jgi:competence protein ComEC
MIREEIRKAPVLRALIPLAAGIASARFLDESSIRVDTGIFPVLTIAVFLAVMAAGQFSARSDPVFNRCCSMLVQGGFFFAGLISLPGNPSLPELPPGPFSGRICSDVVEKERSYRLVMDQCSYLDNGKAVPVEGKIQVYLAKESRCHELGPGIFLAARGRLNEYRGRPDKNGFDYPTYLAGRGIYYTCWLDSLSWSIPGSPGRKGRQAFSPGILALNLRRSLVRKLGGEPVLSAILLGDRGGLKPGLKEDFRRSGSMHILAISGLHVGILVFLPFLLIRRIRRPRYLKASLTFLLLLMLWSYALLAGMSASVSRAAGMCSIYGLAGLTGRRISLLQVLSLAAFTMLLVRPSMLFEAGFQLSFAAISGIAMFFKKLEKLICFARWPVIPATILRGGWRITCLSLAAQAGTAPLVVYHFGEYPVYALITNLAAVPLATLILYNGILFFSLSWMPGPGAVLRSTLRVLGDALEGFTGMMSSLPGAVAGGPALEDMSALQVALVYLLLIFIHRYLEKRSPAAMLAIPVPLLLWLLLSCFNVVGRFTAE